MAGRAICRVFERSGYHYLLTASHSELDLLDGPAVEAWFAEHQPTVVVLAAAKVGGIQANSSYPADFLLENVKIKTHVIETAWRSAVRRLMFLGRSCIYPKFAELPIREESLLTGALETTNEWYAIAKITGIKLCEALRKQHGFDAITLMLTNLYGPGDNYHPTNSHVLPPQIRRFHEAAKANLPTVTCWGTGLPLRDFLHVEDLAEACVFALQHRSTAPSELTYLNVSTGVDLSIRELAEAVASISGYQGMIHWDATKPDGTPKKQLDVNSLAELDWTDRISLAEGLASTVALFRELPNQRLWR
jgi:GDP-L-fucose synthase